MMDVMRGAHGELVIRLAGTFDGKTATRLSGWLGEIPAGDDLVLDFTQVRDCQDLGLAAVARNLGARGARLSVHGLTRHQERLLRYFGVELDGAPAKRRRDGDAVG
jgi:hypothetical protein